MKKHLLLPIAALLAFAAILLFAQTPHTVDLAWTDTANPAGTTYSVWRAPGACSPSSVFTRITSALTAKTYQDSNVPVGNYCYYVTATLSGNESAPSTSTGALVNPFAPT